MITDVKDSQETEIMKTKLTGADWNLIVASQRCCGSSSAADPEIGVSAEGGGGGGPPTPPQGPKTGRVRRMVRLLAELLLLLGLLLLTLHITVLRSSPLPQGNATLDNSPIPSLAEPPVIGGTLQRDGPGAFVLDLHKFPDLAKANMNRQNPNIQVTIEVVDGLEGAEPERDPQKESKPGREVPTWRDWWSRSSPAVTSGNSGGSPDDSNFLKPDWERRGGGATQRGGFERKKQTEYDYIDGDGDWSSWAACSVTCGNGNQKRTRSCGYACTATESRTCDMPACPGIEDAFRTAATEVSLLAGTDEFNATELFGVDTDSCERWMNCKSEFLKKYMLKVASDLPSCPCSYPTEDASSPKERLEIYKPTARYCIRSALTLRSATLAAQHCCYDDGMRLVTRGKGAGSPNLISTEFSEDLHYKVDVLPWVFCKGDWSRYNQARPPNNGRKCEENPSEEDYNKQMEEAREF
ncbi:hypothetical protein SKAU_G00147600 [Synaphobranchus kaupii]|uniref:AMOP domain-containing protein n=1 Tax=Synaphobranchus kaupii TaxID=118154 RepID=A0A9Q1J3X4_SYNKA|nr:hypothetical protein SKAU_G00147600 [Synaphobranchus kaupii]